ncbi:hypothetical protein, partial [Klebsiella pneumoniae]|uniref:hypothetical protein n=1 Tax=Klebsiella pneumoniae TaxID=573 RepID=UPI001D0E73FC
LQPPFAQNGTVVNLRMSTRFCTKGDGFQFLAKFAILPQNANSPFYKHRPSPRDYQGVQIELNGLIYNMLF